MYNKAKRLWTILGPLIISALSFFLAFQILQPISKALEFNLLANRGIGKIAFSVMVLLQAALFITIYNIKFVNNFMEKSILIFNSHRTIIRCAKFFSAFFIFHLATQILFSTLGFAYITNVEITVSVVLRFLFGIFVAFLLAYSEEIIFRGLIYTYFEQFLQPIFGIVITSLIFMFSHDLRNPFTLISTNWRLGLGLFLLGILLNLIFVITESLDTNVGAHMGLVSVKVLLRRAPFIKFLPTKSIWVNSDLRQSCIVHIIFLIVIIFLTIKYREKIFSDQHI